MNELEVTLRLLAEARDAQAAIKDDLAIAQELLEETSAWKKVHVLESWQTATKEKIERLYDYARKLAVDSYTATGNKVPASGVTVRATKKMVYDKDTVQSWLRENQPDLLVFDKKLWESRGPTVNPGLITIEEVPTAAVATDLSWYEDFEENDQDLALQQAVLTSVGLGDSNASKEAK